MWNQHVKKIRCSLSGFFLQCWNKVKKSSPPCPNIDLTVLSTPPAASLWFIHLKLFFSAFSNPGFSAATSMFTFVVLIITIIICLSHVCFGHFKYLSAHNYKVIESLLWILFIIPKCTCMILLNMFFATDWLPGHGWVRKWAFSVSICIRQGCCMYPLICFSEVCSRISTVLF